MSGRFVAVEGIRAVDFGEEWIIFNPLSWDAHLLNVAAASVLELLGSPRYEQEVEAYLHDVLIGSEKSSAALHSRRLLDELVQLRLVRRLPGDDEAHR